MWQHIKQYKTIKVYVNKYNMEKHYDNSKGSLYKFAEDQNLNAWEFDIVKRIVRSRKKGNFKEDLEKTKFLIDLYLEEYEEEIKPVLTNKVLKFFEYYYLINGDYTRVGDEYYDIDKEDWVVVLLADAGQVFNSETYYKTRRKVV